MSIFDSIISDISPFADALGQGISVFTGASGSAGKAGSSSRAGITDMLNQSYKISRGDFASSPTAEPGRYAVTKSKANVTVDPSDLEQQWLRRLDTYSTVVSKSGVKGK